MKRLKNKNILLLLLALFFAGNLFSQTILLNPAETYIGFSGGANGSMVFFIPTVQQKPQIGYTGGLTFRYVNENHFGLQIETNFTQRGWSEKSGNYARQINYLEVPFLSHLYIGKTNRLFLNIGPKISYLLSENIIKNGATDTQNEQYNSSLNKWNYGLDIGTGYNLKTKKYGIFQLELRGYYGLTNIYAEKKKQSFDVSNYINVQVKIGWLLQLTGKKD